MEKSKVSCKVWHIVLLGFAVLYRAAIENTHNFLYFDWILLRFSFVLQYQAVWVILSWLFWVSVSSHWHDRSVLGHTKFWLEFLSCDHFFMELYFNSVKSLQDMLFLFLLNPQLLKVVIYRSISGYDDGRVWAKLYWRSGFLSTHELGFELNWYYWNYRKCDLLKSKKFIRQEFLEIEVFFHPDS